MLAGYFDDSVDQDFFVVGGFVSPVPRWEGFSDDWETVLHQPPRIEYYKAYQASVPPEHRKLDNQFRGFSRGMIVKKEKVLAEVIRAHAEYAVYSPLSRSDFNEIVRPRVLRPKRGLGRYTAHEYHFPFHGCIGATVKHLKENNIRDQVDFFFDEQGKVGKWALQLFGNMKASTRKLEGDFDVRPYLGVCVSHDDKKLVALQAADFFASRARRYKDITVITDPVLAILVPIPCKIFNWPREYLKVMVNDWYPIEEQSALAEAAD